jgi:hypothetical protein
MPTEKDTEPMVSDDATEEEKASIAANIERYLNNHTREGGHAYQHNMAARPQDWHPLELSGDPAPGENHGSLASASQAHSGGAKQPTPAP